MKKLSEILEGIKPKLQTEEGQVFYTDLCLFCSKELEFTDYESNPKAAKKGLEGKFISHLKSSHKGEFIDDLE